MKSKSIIMWGKLYLYRVGVLAHYVAIGAFFVCLVISSMIYIEYDLPLKVFLQRANHTLESSSSPLLQKLSYGTKLAIERLGEPSQDIYQVKYNQTVAGVSLTTISTMLSEEESSERLKRHYKRLNVSALRVIKVSSTHELLNAIATAKPGDDIIISSGSYELKRHQIYFNSHGSQDKPIRLRAENLSDVTLNLDTHEGFVIKGDYWILENLIVNGSCNYDAKCEHAIHIVGASHLIIRNNKLTNFNSTVKANATGKHNISRYPDDILFEYNSVFNKTSRKTNSSVTLIDVVTGNDWVIRKNFVANHSKHGSDNTSYAMFLKGNGRDGLIEKNIIDCQWSLPDDGYTRVGISLGGGGTGEQFCRGGSCIAEHTGGTIQNNLVVNCSQDVAVYLNKAKNSRIIHNTMINSLGVDIRFEQSSASLVNNVLSGKIRTREGGKVLKNTNNEVIEKFNIKDSKMVLSQVETDLCNLPRYRFSPAGAMGKDCINKVSLELTHLLEH